MFTNRCPKSVFGSSWAVTFDGSRDPCDGSSASPIAAPPPVEPIELTDPMTTPRTSTSAPTCSWVPASGARRLTSIVDVKSFW